MKRPRSRKPRNITASFRDTEDALTRLARSIVAASDEGRANPRAVAIVRQADKDLHDRDDFPQGS